MKKILLILLLACSPFFVCRPLIAQDAKVTSLMSKPLPDIPGKELLMVEYPPGGSRFEAMANQLERSDVLFEFLAIMRSAPILPMPLRPVQPLLIRAAIDLTPHWVRTIVGLTDQSLNAWEAEVVRQIGAVADRLGLESNPAVQACRRMRLSANYLY
jgi:uncharacterized protein (DUF2236 family)